MSTPATGYRRLGILFGFGTDANEQNLEKAAQGTAAAGIEDARSNERTPPQRNGRHRSPHRTPGGSPSQMAEKYLHAVSCRGDLDAVKHCLEHAHPCVDGARTRGRTALWEASARGHAAVCAALLDAGASADAEDWSGAGPLVVAARRGRTRAVAAFVQRGHASSTALEAAALKGHDDVVALLRR